MKNIILIITDTFRYDNLGRRHKKPIKTPNIDKFAEEEAVEITNFFSGSFPTIPHRTDLVSGTLGWPLYPWQPLEKSSSNHIAKMLNQSGYVTQLICDSPHLFPNGFQKAFHAAYHIRGQEIDTPFLHLNDPIETLVSSEKTRSDYDFKGHYIQDLHRWTNEYSCLEEDKFPAKTSRKVMRWLEQNYKSTDPFFLWIDFFDPHEPWDPPEYMVRNYDPHYDRTPMIQPNYGSSSAYTREELNNLQAHYSAEVELVDRWIGRILQKIKDTNLWEDSVIVVTSDHGISI